MSNKNGFTPFEMPITQMPRMKFQTGFTLTELIVVISLMVIILGALVALYTTHHQFYNIASTFTELRGYTKNFKNQLSKDIDEAVKVMNSQIFFGTTTYTTSSTELVLQLYAIDSNGDFDTNNYDYIAYRIPTGTTNIKRVVDADDANSTRGDSDRILIEKANSMSFSFYDSSENSSSSNYPATTRIDIDLEVQKTWTGKDRDETIHASSRLRNKR